CGRRESASRPCGTRRRACPESVPRKQKARRRRTVGGLVASGWGCKPQTLQTLVCSLTLVKRRARAPRMARCPGRTRGNPCSWAKSRNDEGHRWYGGPQTHFAREISCNPNQKRRKCCARFLPLTSQRPAVVCMGTCRPQITRSVYRAAMQRAHSTA